MKNEINAAWDGRNEITPCYHEQQRPKLIEILKLLPKTNCRKCGQPTCTVFAVQAMEGGRRAEDCPDLTQEGREKLAAYLADFNFE